MPIHSVGRYCWLAHTGTIEGLLLYLEHRRLDISLGVEDDRLVRSHEDLSQTDVAGERACSPPAASTLVMCRKKVVSSFILVYFWIAHGQLNWN